MLVRKLLLASATSVLLISPVLAETMTFSGLPTSITGPSTYTEDGITVTSASGLFWAWPSAGQLHMDPVGFAGPAFTFTYGGGLFDAGSIDISYSSSGTLTFTGYDINNVALASAVFVAPTGTLDLSAFTGISSLTMVDTGQHISVDNFVLSAAGVPEPASWAMLVAGFGLIGAGLRRRTGAVRVSYT